MKKLSFLLTIMSLMLFTVSLQAQTSGCTKAEKEACKKICSEAASTGFFSFFTNMTASEESQEANATPKASCSPAVVKTAAASKKANCNPANCIPENCPPGCKPIDCLPANCKLRSETKTAVAANLKE